MNAARRVYRDDIVQPILLALIGFQILSGTILVLQRKSVSPLKADVVSPAGHVR